MKEFKFFGENPIDPKDYIDRIDDVIRNLMMYCMLNQENLHEQMHSRTSFYLQNRGPSYIDYGEFMIADVQTPVSWRIFTNAYGENVPVRLPKLEVEFIVTPHTGQSFCVNLCKDYNEITGEYEGSFYLSAVNGVAFIENTIDDFLPV